MEVKRIKTEGDRINKVRNVERLWLELEAVGNGCSVEGHSVLGMIRNDDGTHSRQPTRIEVYADRLNAVLGRTRTDKHRRAYEQACEAHEILKKEWMGENEKRIKAIPSKEARDRWIDLNYNERPEHQLAPLGYKTGLPPIESCKVIHPHTFETMDAVAWQKLPADQRAEWFVAAPDTKDNSARRQADAIAQAIRALAQPQAQERPKQK